MSGVLLLLLCGTCPAEGGPHRAPARGIDLVVLGPNELARVHVQITRGGRPMAEQWHEALAALVRYTDRSADGKLDPTEAARLPTGLSVRQIVWGNLAPASADGPPWEGLDADASGAASLDELAKYYEREGLGAALVSVSSFRGSAALDRAWKQAVDANQDGRLDEIEWTALAESLAKSLAKYDANDDELIQVDELVAGLDYPGSTRGPLLRAPRAGETHQWASFPVAVLPASPDEQAWADSLLRWLDTSDEGRLSPQESRLSAEAFRELDADTDGSLTAAELAAWRNAPPASDVVLDLDRAEGAAEGPPPLVGRGMTIHFRTTAGQKHETLDAAREQILGAACEQMLGAACEQMLDEFAAADRNLDRTITLRDAVTDGQLARVFDGADGNGDKSLSLDELKRWLALQEQLAEALPVLTIVDAGAGLFQQLDANRDGGLSVRELRMAHERLARSGALVDGRLDENRLQRAMQIAASQGRAAALSFALPRTGPEWHQGMDRNGDGDVSPREFLADEAQFRALDTSGDGLIDAREAQAAHGSGSTDRPVRK